jgi:glycosyltransferase involved in cell wall biosynthesis
MVAFVRLRFVTATPLDIRRGSGTYVGIRVLARALTEMGHAVTFETPRIHLPIFTVERLLFNRTLRRSDAFDVTIGFDMDGYRIADVASLKGVIADEVRFERGLTRLTMGIQAARERLHAQRARLVLTTSRYSAERAQEFYGLAARPTVVPELIDLAEWRRALAENFAGSDRPTALFVGRFYRRKRLDVLLRAAAILRDRIPKLELRIVGNGPCRATLHALARELRLDGTVTWLGDVSRGDLAREYNRCTLFCLPSVQEGFGIVLLEAMAAGKPIVAARGAAIPETAPGAALVEPESAGALAAAIESVVQSRDVQAAQSASGLAWVEQFDAPRVAQMFLDAVTRSATYTSV